MNKIKQEIDKSQAYYLSLVSIAEGFSTERPNISIETCKALLEGIFKLILEQQEQKESLEIEAEKRYHNFSKLADDAITKLQEGLVASSSQDLENSIKNVFEQIQNVVRQLKDLRNEYGEICHGRSPQKNRVHCPELAVFVMNVTDSLCVLMLRQLNGLKENNLPENDGNLNFSLETCKKHIEDTSMLALGQRNQKRPERLSEQKLTSSLSVVVEEATTKLQVDPEFHYDVLLCSNIINLIEAVEKLLEKFEDIDQGRSQIDQIIISDFAELVKDFTDYLCDYIQNRLQSIEERNLLEENAA